MGRTRYILGGIGVKDCMSADTSYALSAQRCRAVVLTAHPSNTGRLWIAVGTDALENKGVPLAAGDRISFLISNTDMINVLAKTAGDDLCYQWVN